MNEEELKLLEKIEELPKELNLEIRGLILSEVCLREENQQLKEQLEKERKVRKKSINKIKTLGKFDGEKCTRGLKLWGADFNELLDILDIDKGE